MKHSIILLFLALPIGIFAQFDADKRYEDSLFQHRTLGIHLVTTKFFATEREWLDKEFNPVNTALMNVPGVYSVERIDFNRVLYVTHSEKVTFDDLKQYILPYKQEFIVYNSEPYVQPELTGADSDSE